MMLSLIRFDIQLVNKVLYTYKISKIPDKIDVYCLIKLPYLVYKNEYLKIYHTDIINADFQSDYVTERSKFYTDFIREVLTKNIDKSFEFNIPTVNVRYLAEWYYSDRPEIGLTIFLVFGLDPTYKISNKKIEVIFMTRPFDLQKFDNARIDKMYLKVGYSLFTDIKQDKNLLHLKDLKRFKTIKELAEYIINKHITSDEIKLNARNVINECYKLGIIY